MPGIPGKGGRAGRSGRKPDIAGVRLVPYSVSVAPDVKQALTERGAEWARGALVRALVEEGAG